jgi:hypothetical protein
VIGFLEALNTTGLAMVDTCRHHVRRPHLWGLIYSILDAAPNKQNTRGPASRAAGSLSSSPTVMCSLHQRREGTVSVLTI